MDLEACSMGVSLTNVHKHQPNRRKIVLSTLSNKELAVYVTRQVSYFFPDDLSSSENEIERMIEVVMERVNICFSAINNRYFQVEGQSCFNHLHSDQYAMFLYFLSNTTYREGVNTRLCEKLFYLNKLLNGIDVFYEVELPDIFVFSHPIGAVLGRAKYSNYFLVSQECTVGAAREAEAGKKSVYPVIGKYCAMYKGASILGNCNVGDNCKISAHSLLIDQDLEAHSIYIGTRLNHIIKENRAHDNIWGNEQYE